MIEVNKFPMRSNEVRLDTLHHCDGFIDSSGHVGVILDANQGNFEIAPKFKVAWPVFVAVYSTSGVTFGCRNGTDMVRPCNVKIDFSERARV